MRYRIEVKQLLKTKNLKGLRKGTNFKIFQKRLNLQLSDVQAMSTKDTTAIRQS